MALRLYTVHRRAAGEIELVKEGFCWPAFFFGPLWCAWRRQWLGLLVWIVAALALGLAANLTLGEPQQAAAGFAFAVLVGIVANDWRRWRLERAGFRLVDVVAAASLSEAEEKLAREGRLAPTPMPTPAAPTGPAPWPRAGGASADPLLP